MISRTTIFAIALSLAACGSPIDDKGKSSSKNSVANNSSGNNVSSNNASSNSSSASCGDGVLDAGELCDPAIAAGAGQCPVACEAPACSTASLVGAATACTAQCIVEPVACASGDGCCPMGCDASTDSDCTNACGNGITESPETCDGDCPTQCADQDACTTDTLTGAAASCNVSCSFEPIVACQSGDGCCPAGCTSDRDSDCQPTASCGDGTLDPGELCDGNCPSSCNDGNACTTDVLTGSAAMCTASCTNTAITACLNGDGCCAPGCTWQTDNDCACTPRTCASLGAECGVIDDGCGNQVTCADTCSSFETCTQNQCGEENFIGQDCTDYPQCGSSQDAACLLPPNWPGGYCTIVCNSPTNTACPTGSHCADFDGQNSLCMLDCTSSSQCEAGYECRQWDGSGGMECTPPAPTTTGEVGSACGSDVDCNTGLNCQQEYTGQTTTTPFPGGVCTETCALVVQPCTDPSAVCTAEFLCMAPCVDSTDCRAGWTCAPGTPPITFSHCWPS